MIWRLGFQPPERGETATPFRQTRDFGAGTAQRRAMFVFRYLAALEGTKCILWCYLCWYVAIALQYFDPAPGLWVSSLGIAGLIGFALNLAASQKGRQSDRWVVFRLYLFPFCVSSYSALIKGKGFVLLFPPDRKPLLLASAACLGFVALASGCRVLARRASKLKGTPA